MANPYNVFYTVQESDGRIEFPLNSCKWYEPGDQIEMTAAEFATCAELINPEDGPDCCFPEYCIGDDGAPTGGYRNQVIVPAGETIPVEVASIEGCRPPNMVCFHYCSSCLFVGYDAEPVIGEVSDGTAADPNPTCRDLIDKYGNCVETLYINNPSDVDVLVTLSYYC